MRRAGSALLLLLLVFGAPFALAKVGFYAWGTLNVWAPADFRFLLGVLTLIAWIAWAAFMLSLAVEAVRLVTGGRVSLSLPGLGWSQAIAGGLLAAVIATTVGPALSAVAAPSDVSGPVATAGPTLAASAQTPSPGDRATSTAEPDAVPSVVHVVERGDDLWSLAERYYDAGAKWRAIVEANEAALPGDPVNNLPVGARLVIPNPVATNPVATHTVAPGDTLWDLAEERLGDGGRYTEIKELNSRISDPDYLEVGWTLALPAGESSVGVPVAAASADSTPAPTEGSTASPAPTAATPLVTATPDTAGAVSAPAAALASPAAAAQAHTPPSDHPAAPDDPAQDGPAQDESTDETGHDRLAIRVLVGGVAALAASGIVGGLIARRRERAAARPLGRRFVTPDAELSRFETALGLVPEPTVEAVPREQLVACALRLLAEHWWSMREPTGTLRRALLEDECLTFQFAAPLPSAPEAFARDDYAGRLSIRWAQLATMDAPERPVAYPALVTLGRDAADRLVMVDLARLGVLAVDGDTESVSVTPVSAMLVELSCSPWADELSVRVVTPDETFVTAAAVQEVRCLDAESAVAELERHARERGALLDVADAEYDMVRLDPDRADAWAPVVFLFEEAPAEVLLERMNVALTGCRVGVAAVVPLVEHDDAQTIATPRTASESRLRLERSQSDAAAVAVLEPEGLTVIPQVLQHPAREAISALHEVARSDETLPASWWREEAADASDPGENSDDAADPEPSAEGASDAAEASRGTDTPAFRGGAGRDSPVELESGAGDSLERRAEPPAHDTSEPKRVAPQPTDAASVVTLRTQRVAHGPRLRLFGETAIDGVAGEQPKKAQRRCVEYCAWLMENPSATASGMSAALFVADGTRRSNLSRLRLWLGQTPGGEQYLPEAYNGRITLHPAVTSDWVELRQLVSRGVNRTPSDDLRAALALVDGPPLADAAPGEWAWADTLRSEMSDVVRDIAVVLARRELARGHLDAARWACDRGCRVAPDDELLARELMTVEGEQGHLDEVRRIVRGLTRAAADRGAGLQPKTVELSRRLLDGRPERLPPTGSQG